MTSAADFKNGDPKHDAVVLMAVDKFGKEWPWRVTLIYALEELRAAHRLNKDFGRNEKMSDLDYLSMGINCNQKLKQDLCIARFYLKAEHMKCGPDCTHY